MRFRSRCRHEERERQLPEPNDGRRDPEHHRRCRSGREYNRDRDWHRSRHRHADLCEGELRICANEYHYVSISIRQCVTFGITSLENLEGFGYEMEAIGLRNG